MGDRNCPVTAYNPAGICNKKASNPKIEAGNNRIVEDQDADQTDDYKFDLAGNTERDALGRQFIYDGENKQTEVRDSQSNAIGKYYYDGDGKRVKKVVPNTGETTVFIYDASGKMVAEYSTTVAPQAEAKISYLTSDHLGSPRINTDGGGVVTARHDYQPFGEEIQRASYGADDVRKQFTGYEKDEETDLDFAQARYYSKNLGRFNTVDPLLGSGRVQFPQTWNKFVYVLNNPLLLIDPSGLYECKGTATQCRSFTQAKKAGEEARDKFEKGSKEYKAIDKALKVYGCNAANPACGEKGKNGVTVWFGKSKDENRGATFVTDTTTEKTKANRNGQDIRVVFDQDLIIGDVTFAAGVVAHEGSHAVDAVAWVNSGFSNSLNPTTYQTEKDAFVTQSYVYEKLSGGNQFIGRFYYDNEDSKSGYDTYDVWNDSWKKVDEDRLNNVNKIVENSFNVTPNAQGEKAFTNKTYYSKDWMDYF